jgi:hypothetical protein
MSDTDKTVADLATGIMVPSPYQPPQPNPQATPSPQPTTYGSSGGPAGHDGSDPSFRPWTTPGETDRDGDGIPDQRDSDADGDGIPDHLDDRDSDGDGVPDSREDRDGDGVPDAMDPSPDGGPALAGIDPLAGVEPSRVGGGQVIASPRGATGFDAGYGSIPPGPGFGAQQAGTSGAGRNSMMPLPMAMPMGGMGGGGAGGSGVTRQNRQDTVWEVTQGVAPVIEGEPYVPEPVPDDDWPLLDGEPQVVIRRRVDDGS